MKIYQVAIEPKIDLEAETSKQIKKEVYLVKGETFSDVAKYFETEVKTDGKVVQINLIETVKDIVIL